MKIVRSIKQMKRLSRKLAAEGKIIGLVPTMGYLHKGHVSLIKRAKKVSDVVITTIFVNPKQFAPSEDLAKYPRDEKGDIRKIKEAGGDIVFIPKAAEMYPAVYQTYVNIEGITGLLEGASRPGHFRGVATVVSKLFNMTRPDIAVFGRKDFQQAVVLQKMAADLNYPLRIIVAPTVREKDGLAMSSRNKYFTPEQRKEAICLYQALIRAKNLVKSEKIYDPAKIRREMIKVIRKICPVSEVDYIAFTDQKTLLPVRKIDKNSVCSLAVRLYGVRLIDNMKLV